ncbi:MAG: outer membrane beta-barrel protein [Pseudomonadota bacterium]
MSFKVCTFLQGCLLLFLATQAFSLQNEEKWNGFYVGADMGSVLSKTKMQTSVAPGGTYFNYTQDAPEIAAAADDDLSERSFSGGIFGGYERQFNHIVIGGEASFNTLSLNSSHSGYNTFTSDPSIQFATNETLKANWEGTLRLKIGYAENRWLVYLTGGPAMTNLEYTSSYSDDNSQLGLNLPGAYGSGTTSEMKYGWALGAGGEYAFNDNWFLQIQYLYSDFGTISTDYAITPTPTLSEFSSSMNSSADLTIQSLLVGLIYRF